MKNRMIQAFLIVTVGVMGALSAPATCEEPDNLMSRFNDLNGGLNITQFYFPPSLVPSTEILSQDVIQFIQSRQYGDYAGTDCPKSLPIIGDYPIEIRSLCPWYYQIHHDPERFPASIPEAVPRCLTCVGVNGTTQCERLHQTITVLRRQGCVEGLYRYVESQESVVVGSLCAQRREIESSNQSTDHGGDDHVMSWKK